MCAWSLEEIVIQLRELDMVSGNKGFKHQLLFIWAGTDMSPDVTQI